MTPNAYPDETVTGLCMARWHRTRGSDGADINIRLLEFEESKFDPCVFATTGVLFPPRIARSVHKRQAEFFFGRLAARQALAATAAELASVDIGIGVGREPLWPAGIIGSITHNHRFAAAAVAAGGCRHGIGLDIERILDQEASTSLLDKIVDEQEMEVLHAHGGAWPSSVLLTLAFSAKESLFKAAYRAVGHIFDFDVVRVVALEPATGRLYLRFAQTLCAEFVAQQERKLGFEFIDSDTLITHFVW